MPNFDSDEEEITAGAYEGGHWAWHDVENCLVFVRTDLPETVLETATISKKAPTGTVEFKNDIDVLEQVRFRKRYQRKVPYGAPDIITIQDIKDIALYTAPVQILSPALINMLHLNTTEKFLRALILYCQYYLQIDNAMSLRMAELKTKIRTKLSEVVEDDFKANLSDLRILVTKEYFTILIGGGDTAAFHHMGPMKKSRSLSKKDARLFESLLRMSVQIVWIALGRVSFNKLELEINRLFKSEIFNSVEHTLKTGYLDKMPKEERAVLLGDCLCKAGKLTMRSPLENGVFCERKINFRMFGIGVIKYPESSQRVKKNASSYSSTGGKSEDFQIYPDINMPPWGQMDDTYPEHFPEEPDSDAQGRKCDKVQRLRWLARLQRLLHPEYTSLKPSKKPTDNK